MPGKLGKLMLIAPLAILGMAAFAALGGYVVMRLWNWLTPVMFGWQAITFWQALGLLVLSRLLFGGMGLRGNGGSGFGRRMRERWVRMDPEERERFRRSMFERYGAGPSPGEPTGE
ncbi:MAG TPA: hypothetical protein VN896_11805 [Methylomirabilota bacterium]|nr:hypothetical protein [Methylomirabilota bacterium]